MDDKVMSKQNSSTKKNRSEFPFESPKSKVEMIGNDAGGGIARDVDGNPYEPYEVRYVN